MRVLFGASPKETIAECGLHLPYLNHIKSESSP